MTDHRDSGQEEPVMDPCESSASADRAGVGRDDNPSRDPHLQRAYEREWKRHPAQIELLQTIVLKLGRIIELLEAPDA